MLDCYQVLPICLFLVWPHLSRQSTQLSEPGCTFVQNTEVTEFGTEVYRWFYCVFIEHCSWAAYSHKCVSEDTLVMYLCKPTILFCSPSWMQMDRLNRNVTTSATMTTKQKMNSNMTIFYPFIDMSLIINYCHQLFSRLSQICHILRFDLLLHSLSIDMGWWSG